MRYILLLAFAFTPSVAVEQGFKYQTVELRGWTVHFEQALVQDKELYGEVELLLQAKLREIDSRLPS